MSSVVRSSKYRHVFGTANKPDQCYLDLKVSRSAWDSNLISANDKFFALNWEATGGGSFLVLPHGSFGKIGSSKPLITGHKGAVLDTAWNPFNDYLVASASEDSTVKIWSIPEGGPTKNMTEAAQTLSGHGRKVGGVYWHPLAENVLASSSTDGTVKIWDVSTGQEKANLGSHQDFVLCCDWSADGKTIATTSKDKGLRIFDPRAGTDPVSQTTCHDGVKGSRVVYLGSTGKLLTVGFTKQSEREYKVWDLQLKQLAHKVIDSSAGQLMPFFDADTNVLFLAGKGDGNVRYFELTDKDPYLYSLSEHKSTVPQRGMAFLPKYSCNVKACEIASVLKLTKDSIEPVSFCVPRKSDTFQPDLFPDTHAPEPSLGASEWFAGQNKPPKMVSMETFVRSSGKKEASFTQNDGLPDDRAALEAQLAAIQAKLSKMN